MISNRQLFLRSVAQTSPEPMMLEIDHAEGIYMFDTIGKKYLDLIAGISVSNLGHCNPAVNNAIKTQLEKYTHLMVYGEFIQAPQVELAAWLSSQLPGKLDSCFFVNSGSEAVEGALKLARRHTGRKEILSCVDAYHGSTMGALSAGGSELYKRAFRPLIPGFRKIRFNQFEDLEIIGGETAAVLIEVIQAESGINLPSPGYLREVRDRCNEMGALLIFDEIQTGMGRTGSLFAFEHYDVIPDILLLAKGFGAGMPLGAFISSRNIMQSLTHDPVLGHITTFGGHPVSCAASLAGALELKKGTILKDVGHKERIFKDMLIHPAIKEIRAKGLFMALEFESQELNFKVIQNCVQEGLITDWFLFAPHCLRIAPPLIINEEEIAIACSMIIKAIKKAVA